jgi:hypothetical protein
MVFIDVQHHATVAVVLLPCVIHAEPAALRQDLLHKCWLPLHVI